MDDTSVVLIVFWVIVVNPLVGYAIGERKGNVATGIILGLLLGPIGWRSQLQVEAGNVIETHKHVGDFKEP